LLVVAVLDLVGLLLLVPVVFALSEAEISPDLPDLGELSVEMQVTVMVGFAFTKTLAPMNLSQI
jgi:hypothetical protein